MKPSKSAASPEAFRDLLRAAIRFLPEMLVPEEQASVNL